MEGDNVRIIIKVTEWFYRLILLAVPVPGVLWILNQQTFPTAVSMCLAGIFMAAYAAALAYIMGIQIQEKLFVSFRERAEKENIDIKRENEELRDDIRELKEEIVNLKEEHAKGNTAVQEAKENEEQEKSLNSNEDLSHQILAALHLLMKILFNEIWKEEIEKGNSEKTAERPEPAEALKPDNSEKAEIPNYPGEGQGLAITLRGGDLENDEAVWKHGIIYAISGTGAYELLDNKYLFPTKLKPGGNCTVTDIENFKYKKVFEIDSKADEQMIISKIIPAEVKITGIGSFKLSRKGKIITSGSR